jgi:ligand-binding sensor domain-containing protein
MKLLSLIVILSINTSCTNDRNWQKQKMPTKTSVGQATDTLEFTKILSNNIMVIYQDQKNNYWFGTVVLGVCRYNGKSFDWITEQDVTEIHDGPSNGVRSIAEDKNGDFWFNTAYRYSVYNENPSTKAGINDSIFYKRVKSIGSLDGKKESDLNKYLGKIEGDLNEYLSIIKDDNNHLWIATYLNGVWRYDGEKISHYPIQVNATNIPIFCLYKDNNGAIWLGTHENGVFKFNGQTFEQFTI